MSDQIDRADALAAASQGCGRELMAERVDVAAAKAAAPDDLDPMRVRLTRGLSGQTLIIGSRVCLAPRTDLT